MTNHENLFGLKFPLDNDLFMFRLGIMSCEIFTKRSRVDLKKEKLINQINHKYDEYLSRLSNYKVADREQYNREIDKIIEKVENKIRKTEKALNVAAFFALAFFSSHSETLKVLESLHSNLKGIRISGEYIRKCKGIESDNQNDEEQILTEKKEHVHDQLSEFSTDSEKTKEILINNHLTKEPKIDGLINQANRESALILLNFEKKINEKEILTLGGEIDLILFIYFLLFLKNNRSQDEDFIKHIDKQLKFSSDQKAKSGTHKKYIREVQKPKYMLSQKNQIIFSCYLLER